MLVCIIYFLPFKLTLYYVYILVPSGPPLNLTAFPISATSILVEWTVPGTYDQNGIIDSYYIVSSINADKKQSVDRVLPVSDNSTRFCFLLNGLEEASTYEIEVTARTVVGSGIPNSIITSTFNTGLLFKYFFHERQSVNILYYRTYKAATQFNCKQSY